DVATSLVVHNAADLLPGCLRALSGAARSAHACVVVADTGSADDPAAICEQAGVPFLPGANHGLAAAFNRALALDEVRGARYVLQLNPDIVLPAGALDRLVGLADQHPRSGILAPRQLDQDDALICSIGVEPSPATYWRAITQLP